MERNQSVKEIVEPSQLGEAKGFPPLSLYNESTAFRRERRRKERKEGLEREKERGEGRKEKKGWK